MHLKRVFLLLDARRGITDTDLETMNIFDNIPVLVCNSNILLL